MEEDSPAARGGIQTGDVIVEFNGEKVPNVAKFRIAVATSKAGTVVPVRIIRDKKEMDISIELDFYPEDKAAAEDKKDELKLSHGITVDDVTSDAAKRLNIKETEGVVITKIEAGSAAAKAGLMTGQIILRINNLPVNTPEEFRLTLDGQIDAMSKADRNTITLYIKDRNNNYRYVVLRFDSPKEEE